MAVLSQAIPKKWIKLSVYLQEHKENYSAVYERIRKGKWRDGIHYKMKDRRYYINEPAIQEWIESGD